LTHEIAPPNSTGACQNLTPILYCTLWGRITNHYTFSSTNLCIYRRISSPQNEEEEEQGETTAFSSNSCYCHYFIHCIPATSHTTTPQLYSYAISLLSFFFLLLSYHQKERKEE